MPRSRRLPGALVVAALLVPVARADDLVPAAVDALLTVPKDPFFFGIKKVAPATKLLSLDGTGPARCALALGDVNGDARDDFAVGLSPLAAGATLVARDGATGAVLWSARPDEGGLRTLRSLARADARLLVGASSVHGRVECREAASGSVLWAVDLRPAGGPTAANVLAVDWLPDVTGDGVPEALVAAGEALGEVRLLSGADGSPLWSHAAGGPAADAHPTGDLDADGRPDVLVAGGVASPFVRALSGLDGSVLWDVTLSAPGSVVAPLPDVDGDGLPDVAVGLFAQPAPCLQGRSGADGSALWEASYVIRDLTSIIGISDVEGDGRPDIAVGSFDNAISAVTSLAGLTAWRYESSTNDTGTMLSVANAGDVDGNGWDDVLAGGMDQRAVLIDGALGYVHWIQNVRSRVTAVARLSDQTGDGYPEFLVCGQVSEVVFDGTSGTVDGPELEIVPPPASSEPLLVKAYAYPSSQFWLFGSLDPLGSLPLPGWKGSFQLSPATLTLIQAGGFPAAGVNGFQIPAAPHATGGVQVWFQAATKPPDGPNAFSAPVGYKFPD